VASTASSTELGALIVLTYYQKVKIDWEGRKRGKGRIKLQESFL